MRSYRTKSADGVTAFRTGSRIRGNLSHGNGGIGNSGCIKDDKSGCVYCPHQHRQNRQNMTVFLDGVERYYWPVSTGPSGYSTPSGTFTPTSMNEVWYSKQWDNSPTHAIFFMKDGHAIHGSYEVKHLGKPVSHGCVRISPQNAATLYDLVKKNRMAFYFKRTPR